MNISWANYWWDEPKYEAHSSAWETVRAIEQENAGIIEDYKHYALLYKEHTVLGFEAGDWKKNPERRAYPVSLNAIRSIVDSVTSKITAHNPSPRFLTTGGNETLQEKAKKLEKFAKGIIYEQDVYAKARRAFRDACLYGLGVLKIYPYQDEIQIDIVHPSRIIVDNNAALEGDPRTLYHKQYYDREALKSLFPKSKTEIEGAKVKTKNSVNTITRDLIEVYEGWHKGIPGITRGRHAIFIEGHTLWDEDWDEEEFPFAFLRYSEDIMGWYGIGIAEMLAGNQLEISRVVRFLQNEHQNIKPFYYVDRASNINYEELLTNEEDRLVEGDGQPPAWIAPEPASQQTYSYLEYLYNKSYELIGMSQLFASGKKPEGLDSGVALRTIHDIETQRFGPVAFKWSDFIKDVVERSIDVAKQLATDEGFEVTFVGSDLMEKINWKDVDMDKTFYSLQISNASHLPETPAAKIQSAIELVQAQMVSPEEGRQMIGHPDLEKSDRLATAHLDDLEATFEHFLSGKEYIEPLPFQDLETGVKLGTSYYLRAKMNGAKKENLDKIYRWCQEAHEQIKEMRMESMREMMAMQAIQQPPVPGTVAGAEIPPAGALRPEGVPPPVEGPTVPPLPTGE